MLTKTPLHADLIGMDVKRCKGCNTDKPLSEFQEIKKSESKFVYRGKCHRCRYEQRRAYYDAHPQVWESRKQIEHDQRKEARQDKTQRAKFIYRDSKGSDRKKNLQNDLCIEFIEGLICGGCSYCGSQEKLSLDRRDNSIGHIQTNVVSACWHCNYIRRDMPWDAWMLVVPSIKAARESGLFDGWRAGGRA